MTFTAGPSGATGPTLALVGATGQFAEAVMRALAMREDHWGEIKLLSPEITTRTLTVRGEERRVDRLTPESFAGVDVALFNLHRDISREWAQTAVAAGCVVVDASAAHRCDDEVPLVVPEINGARVADRPKGVIALPGPVTWALVDAAHVLHQTWELQLLVVTAFIAADARASAGTNRLRGELESVLARPGLGQHPGDIRSAVADLPGESPFAAPLAFNVIPWVGQPGDAGWTSAEQGLAAEIKKILEIPHIPVVPTLVQVPVLSGHSMAVHARFARSLTPQRVRQAFTAAPALVVIEEHTGGEVPTPVDTVGIDPRFVGRIRQPEGLGRTIDFFLSADTIRRGASAMVKTAELVAAELR